MQDALDLGVTELDRLRLGGDLLSVAVNLQTLSLDLLQQLLSHFSQRASTQTLQVWGCKSACFEHAWIVQRSAKNHHR